MKRTLKPGMTTDTKYLRVIMFVVYFNRSSMPPVAGVLQWPRRFVMIGRLHSHIHSVTHQFSRNIV